MSQHAINRLWGVLLFFLFVQASPLLAQGQHLVVREWTQGKVFLKDSDTLSGVIRYYHQGELLEVRQADGTVKTYSPLHVAGFTVFNDQTRRFQFFRSYLWSRPGSYNTFKTPSFFEVVAEGKYTLIQRETRTVRNQDPIPRYASQGRYYESYPAGDIRYKGLYSQVVAVKQFYVLTPEQEIRPLRNPRKDLPALFQDKAPHMQQFMKHRNLSYHNSDDLVPVIRQFNRL